jgi:hypothetical protein
MAADYQYNNPLLEDFLFPPYDAIQPKHVSPAILSLLDQLVRCVKLRIFLLFFFFFVLAIVFYCNSLHELKIFLEVMIL